MKTLKTVGLVVLTLLGLVLILGALAPKHVSTSRSLVINAPPQAVFAAVNHLPTWNEWSPWQRRDTTTRNVFSPQKEGAGAYFTWTSKKSGAGKLTITDSYPPDSLHLFLEFDGQGDATSNWYFRPVEGGTEATWTLESDFPYPFNAMLLVMNFPEMMNKDYDEGLALLKTYVENNQPTPPAYTLQTIDFPATHYLVQREVVAMDQMGAHFQKVMPAVATAFLDNQIKMAGVPTGLFFSWDEANQTSDVAIGIPAASNALVKGLTVLDIPAGKAVAIDYIGPYEGTGTAHEAIDAYLKANGLTAKLPAIEQYFPDPGPDTKSDPNKWLTKVIYLLEEME